MAEPLLMDDMGILRLGDGHGTISGTAIDDHNLTHEPTGAREAFAQAGLLIASCHSKGNRRYLEGLGHAERSDSLATSQSTFISSKESSLNSLSAGTARSIVRNRFSNLPVAD